MKHSVVLMPGIQYDKNNKWYESSFRFYFDSGIQENVYTYFIRNGKIIKKFEHIHTVFPEFSKEEMIEFHDNQVIVYQKQLLEMILQMDHLLYSDKSEIKIINENHFPMKHQYTLKLDDFIYFFEIKEVNGILYYSLNVENSLTHFFGVEEEIKNFLFEKSMYRLKFLSFKK